MAVGANRKISAASARAHTRRAKQSSSFPKVPSEILTKILLVLSVGALAWAYQAIQPPPPKTCGSPGGPPITAPRIKLRDGRYLTYKEHGISIEEAKFKIVSVHGFDGSRHDVPIARPLSPEMARDLAVYIVSFDRPGYGESDPHPKRTLKSLVLDIEELADQLKLGSKFYIAGFSMGGELAWSCLKYIPHRLAGVSLLAPVTNFWWPGFPANLSKEACANRPPRDQWAERVAHYAPWLTYWWNTQKIFPISSAVAKNPDVFSAQDKELLSKLLAKKTTKYDGIEAYSRQQGEYESIHRDMMIGFGSWDFDPMDLENPFPNNEGSVHLWQGDDDILVPAVLQRYIAERLPWIRYHELPGSGHLFPLDDEIALTILKTMLA